jgi:hypothetical protein
LEELHAFIKAIKTLKKYKVQVVFMIQRWKNFYGKKGMAVISF